MYKNYKLVGWYVIIALLAWGMLALTPNCHFDPTAIMAVRCEGGGAILILFLLLVSITVIGYALFRKTFIPFTAAGIIGLSFLAWYGFTGLNLLGVAILVLLNWEAYKRVGREVVERIKVNSSKILWHGLYPLVLGIFILASFALYQSSFVKDLEKAGQLPSQTKAFFEHLADKFLTPQLDLATPKERQSVVNQVASQAYQQANTWLKPYFRYAPPFVAFGLFLILWGLSWIFVALATAIGVILFWILKKTKVVRIEEKDVKAEVMIV